MEAAETAIRAHAGDNNTPANAFQVGGKAMGHFWEYQGIRPYMVGRYFLVLALLKVNNKPAVEAALEHGLDMLRLNHDDNQGLRCIIPALYLRLGRDQDCYDHLVWWLLYGRGDNQLHWGHPDAIVKDYNALEPVADFLKGIPDLSQLVALALVKIRMLIDVRKFQSSTQPRTVECISDIIAKDREIYERGAAEKTSAWLRSLVVDMYVGVWCHDKEFWGAMLTPEEYMAVGHFQYKSVKHGQLAVTIQECYNSWAETPGALAVLEEMQRDPEVQQKLARLG